MKTLNKITSESGATTVEVAMASVLLGIVMLVIFFGDGGSIVGVNVYTESRYNCAREQFNKFHPKDPALPGYQDCYNRTVNMGGSPG